MDNPDFIDARRVAALLGLEGARPDLMLLQRRAVLEAQGFPLPMPTSARPLLWRAASVRAWLDAAALLAEVGERPRVAGAAANDRAFQRAMGARRLEARP